MTEVCSGNNENNHTTLSSIYQARKSGDRTVNVLKKQFQNQIGRVVSDVKNDGNNVNENGVAMNSRLQRSGYIPSSNEKEMREFKKLNREKSFDEARTAVQSQIEKIFQKAAAKKAGQLGLIDGRPVVGGAGTEGQAGVPIGSPPRRYTMHGVSHLAPEEMSIMSPLPIHHGVTLQVSLQKNFEKIGTSLISFLSNDCLFVTFSRFAEVNGWRCCVRH